MFRRLAGLFQNGREALFQLHPLELVALLELAWNLRAANGGKELGHPDRRSDLAGVSVFPPAPPPPAPPPPPSGPLPSAQAFATALVRQVGEGG